MKQEVNPMKKKTNYTASFISGGCAGMAAKFLIAPFDRVKILFQTTARPFSFQAGVKEALFVYKGEGLRGLWRGNLVTMLRIFPYSATQFVVFDYFQPVFQKPGSTRFQRNFANFVAGSLAGIAATIVTYPTEFLRTRMAMQRDVIIYQSLGDAIKKIHIKEGSKAFFRGIFPSFVGVIPYKGTGFLMFHLLKDSLKQRYPELVTIKTFDFVFGAIAGLIAQLATYPFDTIRKKMQAEAVLLERGEITSKKSFTGWSKHILAKEGKVGLYKGVTMNVVKGPIASGTAFTVKNLLHQTLDKKF